MNIGIIGYTPTVIFFDEAMNEVRRYHTKEEIYEYLGI